MRQDNELELGARAQRGFSEENADQIAALGEELRDGGWERRVGRPRGPAGSRTDVSMGQRQG